MIITATIGTFSIAILAVILAMIFTGQIHLPEATEPAALEQFLRAVDGEFIRVRMLHCSFSS
jgi:hypothetical protein